jgi:hypothetical protein
MAYACPYPLPNSVETFTGITRSLEIIVFLLQFGQKFVEFGVMRSVDVVCQLLK